MEELYLQKFFIEHPDNWEELLTSAPYSLKISRDNGYMLFKYNMLDSDFSLPEVKEARGIIFRESDKKCVCHPFNKFMNAEETNSDLDLIDWNHVSVQQKIDGSLMKVWFDDGWHISTNGTIDAFKAIAGTDIDNKTFGSLFLDALHMSFESFTGLLCNYYTYMFELVSPITQVVIKYPETKLYLLGVRNNEDHQEYLPEVFDRLRVHFDIPKRYELHSYGDVVNAANALNQGETLEDEGFVVCDFSFHRVKVKSPEYLRGHFIRNNNVVTFERVIETVLSGDTEEFLIYLPEYTNLVNEISNGIKWFKSYKVPVIIQNIKPESYPTRKDYAEEVKKYPAYLQQFLFAYDRLDSVYSRLSAEKWKEILIKECVIDV